MELSSIPEIGQYLLQYDLAPYCEPSFTESPSYVCRAIPVDVFSLCVFFAGYKEPSDVSGCGTFYPNNVVDNSIVFELV